jgi:type I restriction enzyme, S subunit
MSSNEWRKAKLGEVVDSISQKHLFDTDKIILVNTSDILEGKVLNHKYVPNKNLRGQFKKAFKKSDILYSEIRPRNKRFAYIDFDAKDYVASTKLIVLRKKNVDITSDFLYQVLKSDYVINRLQHIAESRSGTFPQITFTELSKLEISLPPLQEQKAIADTLSSLDDKIELNNKINSILEQISKAIFKHWFIDFEFPNEEGKPYKLSGGEFVDSEFGKIPKGWKICRLLDCGKVICGKTPPKSVKNYFGGYMPFVKIPDMHSNIFIIKTEDSLTEQGKRFQVNKTIPSETIIVSCIATVGLVSITSSEAQTNQQINSLIPFCKSSLYYLYFRLKDLKNYFKTIGSSGSATLNINTTIFSNIKVIMPKNDILEKFNDMVSPIFNYILANSKENITLTKIRDTLLPKLITGKIRVNLEDTKKG